MNLKKKATWAAVLIGLTALAGCGGGTTAVQPPQAVNGVVADGYLTGAIVCLDTTGDKKCGDETYKATTTAGGAYSIPNVTAADLAKYPIIVEVPTTAVDSERGAVTSAYFLSAPAGKPEFISPLTTLVQNQIETNGLSVTEAVATVKSQLGLVTLSPMDDYKPGVLGSSPEAVMAAGVAKVIATTIASNKSAIETAVAGSATPVTVQQVINLIVQQVMQNLANVVQQVSVATNNGANALAEGSVAGVVTASGGAVSVTDATVLQQQLTAAGTTTVSSDLVAAATAGMYSVDRWQNGNDANNVPVYVYEYQKVLFNSSSNTISFNRYFLSGAAWVADTNSGDTYLIGTEWKTETVTNSGKFDPASNVYSTVSGYEKAQVRAVKIDVSGQSISSYLKGSAPAMNPGTVFPAGSLAFKLTFVPVEDIYRLDNGDSLCKTYTNNVCSGYANLDDLLVTASYNGNWVGYDNGSFQFGPLDSVTKTGQIKITPSNNGMSGSPYYATYKRTTVNGVDMIIADLTSLQGRFMFAAVYNGVVRGGSYQKANVAQLDNGINFNKAAVDAIISAAGLPASLGKKAAK